MSNENIENRFTESVTSFSIRNGLFKTDCKYLVALSGGADSVALLLVRWGLIRKLSHAISICAGKSLTEMRISVSHYAKDWA